MGNRSETLYQRERKKFMVMSGVCLGLLILVIVLVISVISLNGKVNRLMRDQNETTAGTGEESGSQEFSSSREEMPERTEDASAGEVGGTVAEDTPEVTTEDPVQYVVCLDAGHGGKRGATSTLDGRFESYDTLRLTLAIQRELSRYEDVTIVMTRTEDVDVENKARPEMANDAGADLFVSIHRNSSVSGDKYGVEGWIDKNDPADSHAAAEMMLAAMEAVGITLNCGVKTGSWDEPDVNYTVIEYAEMPAVLLEVGYLNHAKDNELFDKNLDAYGKAIADAIYDWLIEWAE